MIITGCNKGVGYGILKNLIEKPFNIIMACRNKDLAEKARIEVSGND